MTIVLTSLMLTKYSIFQNNFNILLNIVLFIQYKILTKIFNQMLTKQITV